MTGPLGRFAAHALRHSQRSTLQQLPRAAAVHTVPDSQNEAPEHVSPDVYAREEHKWDESALDTNPRARRFPATLSVPEGGARVAMPDFPSIVRHSLAEPAYGSFGYSLRDPPYEYIPKRRASTFSAAPSPPNPAVAPQPSAHFHDTTYQPDEHKWCVDTPLPAVAGSWHKADW